MLANAYVVLIAAFSLFLLWLAISSRRALIITPALRLVTFGSIILAIPLIYSPAIWAAAGAWRVAGLVLGVLFLFSCLQLRYSRGVVYAVLGGMLALVAVQASIALLQLFAPAWSAVPLYGNRVYGAFYQPNVLASFISTGLALALMLFLLPGFVLARAQYECCRQWVLIVLLVVFTALLVWGHSRAGWLGGIAVAVSFLWCLGRELKGRCVVATGALLLGVLLGIGVLLAGGEEVVINHEGSNQARWTMLCDTLAMIVEKPFLGWGYGGFEYSFQHFRINQTPPTVVSEIARHPHNEILLWVVEGGVVAWLGVILILLGGVRIVRQAVRHDRLAFAEGRCMAGIPTALCIAQLPMAIHTQLEFPFYLSTLHFVVFLLLMAMADRLSGGVIVRRSLSPTLSVVVAGGMPALALGVAVMAGFAIKGSLALAQVEKFGMQDVTPLKMMPSLSRQVNQERVAFDEQVNALLIYNRTREARLLEEYRQWAQSYLTRRIDKNVYASLLQILQHQGELVLAERYRRDAERLFPNDVRFTSAPIGVAGQNVANEELKAP